MFVILFYYLCILKLYSMADSSFFDSTYRVEGITPEDYDRAGNYIKSLDVVSTMSYESIYVLDFFQKRFLFVSNNRLFLCGLTSEEVMRLGNSFYIQYIPKDELWVLNKTKNIFFRFLQKQSSEERSKFSASCNFYIKHNGGLRMVNHKITPLAFDPNGNVWLAVCSVSISNHDESGNIEVRKLGQSDYWKFDLDLDRWIKAPGVKLTEGEKEVLLLSARGLTVDEIAERVHRAKDSIKSRRRAIFEKLGVKSISEAIAFATNYKLI